MIAPGPLHEVGRHGQDLGAGQRERPVQLGEAQVVADREAERHAVDLGHDRAPDLRVTRSDSVSTGPSSTDTSNRWILR